MFVVAQNDPERVVNDDLADAGTSDRATLDALCRLAAALCRASVARISLREAPGPAIARGSALCAHVAATGAALVVADASLDAGFCDDPLVDAGIRFYAGLPLVIDGEVVGTLCVMDGVARDPDAVAGDHLRDIADLAVAQLRRSGAEAARRSAMAERMAQVGHWHLALPDRGRFWSEEMYAIFGLDPAAGVPAPEEAIRLYHPADRDRVQRILASAACEGRDVAFQARLVRPSGEVRDVVLRSRYEPAGPGTGAACFGVVIDVTETNLTRRQAEAGEGRFRRLVEAITDCAICMLDPDGRVTNWHAGAERLHGYTADEAVGQHVSRFYPAAERESGLPQATLAAALRDGRSEAEGRRLRKDGTEFCASVVTEPMRDAAGTLVGFAQITRDVTEQRQAAEALRVNEARYRMLADHTTDMIAQLDAEGRRLYVSPASRELLGFTPTELVGTRPLDSMHPDDVPAFSAIVADLRSGRRDRAVSLNRLRHRDGRWIWVEASLHVLKDEAGGPHGFLASVRNVADRHRAEEALRESEARYRALADSLPQMVWIMDPASRDTIYANRRFLDYYEGIGPAFAERIDRYHPDDVEAVHGAFDAGFTDGAPHEIEVRLRRADGAYRWHRVVFAPIYRGTGVSGRIGTALDIHDVVVARQRLLESADLLRIAQEAAGAGTWDIDMVTGAAILSQESAAMHGLAAAGPVAMTLDGWGTLVHGDDVARVLAEVARAVEAHDTYAAEFRVPLADGSIRWVQGIGRAYYDAKGQATRMTGLNFDVDKRKRVEAALIEANAAAEAARREAEMSSAAKSDFLAAMSHEIRTPLNSILGYTELLLGDGGHRTEDAYKLSRILGSGHALLTIVNDVLDFSKIEAGRIELEPQSFALAGLVADTMSMIRGTAAGKPIALRAELDPRLPAYVVGDPNRLRQVLLNLMNNAVKFTREGDVVLALREAGRDGERVGLRCTVSDTGIGIPADKRHLLFKRFSQVDGSISRHFGGTGLGLAISKSLIDLMGGGIGVEDRGGGGSTFWFEVALPVAEAPRVVIEPARPPEAAAVPARVLLVEDVAMNREIAQAVLHGGGHRVDLACDGAEAVQAVRRARYDVVFMDVQMPVMDGLEATTRIRALGGDHAALPIVALTANVLPEQIARFRLAGMNDHVGKPFRRDELLAAVARWSQGGAAKVGEGEAAPAADVIDKAALDGIAEILGRDKLVRLLRNLEATLTGEFSAERLRRAPPPQVAATAHKLVSSAGMLGFMPLSEICRGLETACLAGTLAEPDLAKAEAAGHAALAAIRSLTAEPRADGPWRLTGS